MRRMGGGVSYVGVAVVASASQESQLTRLEIEDSGDEDEKGFVLKQKREGRKVKDESGSQSVIKSKC